MEFLNNPAEFERVQRQTLDTLQSDKRGMMTPRHSIRDFIQVRLFKGEF